MTAARAVRLDIVGVITLGMITALGGGIIRDILLDNLPVEDGCPGDIGWHWLAAGV